MNLMINRLVLAFVAFVSSLVTVFASNHDEVFILFKPIVLIFGKGGIPTLLGNDLVLFGLIYAAYFWVGYLLLKIVFKLGFGSNHEKEANTIALLTSFIGVSAMFYMFVSKASVGGEITSSGIKAGIIMFGGTVGFLLLSVVLLFVIYSIHKATEESRWHWTWIAGVFYIALTLLLGYVKNILKTATEKLFWENSKTYIQMIIEWVGLVFIVLAILAIIKSVKSRANSPEGKEMAEESKELKEKKKDQEKDEAEIKAITDRIHSNLEKINTEMNKIKGGLL